MFVQVVTPPTPVVTLAEAKDHLRVTHAHEDALIEGFVAAATGHIDGPDGWLGRAIGIQTLEATVPTWCVPENFALPYPPLVSVTSVTYRDAQRQTITAPPGSYEVVDGLVEAIGDVAWIGAQPAKNGLRVRYVAGYAALPPAIRAAILLMVGDLYRNRSSVVSGLTVMEVPMSTTVTTLLQPFRVYA